MKNKDTTKTSSHKLKVSDKFTDTIANPILFTGYVSLMFASVVSSPFSKKTSDRLEAKANSIILE